MSEFQVELIHIDKVDKHPDADSLSIAKVYDYPVIVKTEEFEKPTLAAYFPVDAVLPDHPLFSFMWKGTRDPSERKRRVKAIRLRGIFSMGLLMPLSKIKEAFPQLNGELLMAGDDISSQLGVVKYEEPVKASMGGNNRRGPEWFIKYTDIENARKYAAKIMKPGEKIVITEKIHGCNARFMWRENGDENDGLWVGSRKLAKVTEDENVWSTMAKKLNLAKRLKKFPNIIIFGEIYGTIQGGFTYDSSKEPRLRLFDAYDTTNGTWLHHLESVELAWELGLEYVPIMFYGYWSCLDNILHFAEGPTTLGGHHVREGFVVKPTTERFDPRFGRVILKIHGEGFLTRGKK